MNENNLIPQSERTKDEQREIARMGGIASGIARREKKQFREYLEKALSNEMKNDKGERIPLKMAGMINLAKKCAEGDLKAIELALKILGEITEKAEVKHEFTNEMTLEEWHAFIKDARGE